MLHGGPGFYGYMNSLGKRLPQHQEATYFPQRGTLANPKPLDDLSLEAHYVTSMRKSVNFLTTATFVLSGIPGVPTSLFFTPLITRQAHKSRRAAPAPLTMESAQKFESNLNQRMSPADRARSDELELKIRSAFESGTFDETSQELANERLNLAVPYYHYDKDITGQLTPVRVDFQSFIASQNGLWKQISNGTIPQCFKNISVPTLLIQGVDDPIPYREVAENLKNHLPKLQHSTFNKCGHFPWLEPASKVECVAAIVQFLDG